MAGIPSQDGTGTSVASVAPGCQTAYDLCPFPVFESERNYSPFPIREGGQGVRFKYRLTNGFKFTKITALYYKTTILYYKITTLYYKVTSLSSRDAPPARFAHHVNFL